MAQTFNFIRNYLLLDLLHTGTTSELFRAVEISDQRFQKTVIVKRFLPWVSEQGDLIERYQDLITTYYPTTGDFFVKILDQGSERGHFFQVRDYIRGQTLDRLIHVSRSRNRPLSIELALFIASQLCRGLHFLEESSVEFPPDLRYHGYLNPATVMVSYEGEVKILNYGMQILSPLYQRNRGRAVSHDLYRAPESRAGEFLSTITTDFYSLGAIMFEMVTGLALFPEEGLHAEADTIPQRLTQQQGRLPRKLHELIVTLTNRAAAHRPRTTGQILAELNQLVDPDRRREMAISLKKHVSEVFSREIVEEREKLDADRERYSRQLGLTFEGEDKYLEPTSVVKMQDITNTPTDFPVLERTVKINTGSLPETPGSADSPMSARDIGDFLDQAIKQLVQQQRAEPVAHSTPGERQSNQEETTDMLRVPESVADRPTAQGPRISSAESVKEVPKTPSDRVASFQKRENTQPMVHRVDATVGGKETGRRQEDTDVSPLTANKGNLLDRISLLNTILWILLLVFTVLLGLVIINY